MSSYFQPANITTLNVVAGDLLVGNASGLLNRLAIGANGTFLNVSGGAIRWGNTIDTGGLTITAGGLTVTAGGITVTAGNLSVSAANASLLMTGAGSTTFTPGTGGLLITNNAGNANNFILSDAGAGTIRAGLTISGGSLRLLNNTTAIVSTKSGGADQNLLFLNGIDITQIYNSTAVAVSNIRTAVFDGTGHGPAGGNFYGT